MKKHFEAFSPAFLAACLALLLWSGTAIANKFAVLYMDGLTAGVLRSMLAGFVALTIALMLRLPFPRSWQNRLLLLTSGIASFALWPILMSIGIEHTSAGHAALIMALIPIFTVLIASTLQRIIPNSTWWFGAMLAFSAGIALMFERGLVFEDAGNATLKGDFLILIGGAVCAVGYVAGGKLSKTLGSLATTFWGLSLALLILIPIFAMISDQTTWSEVPTNGWLAIAWMTLLSSLAAYILWFFALAKGGVSRIGSLQLAMPIATLIAAAILLHEPLTLFLIIICSILIGGTFLAHRNAPRS